MDHAHGNFAFMDEVYVVTFLSLFDNVIAREEQDRLEPTDKEALFHTAAFLKELNVL